MAFTAKVEWDVRTTGSNSNGGGFDPISGTPGTDYSQQDSPQIAYTDMVIGVTTTTFTSVANSPAASLVGNIINVTGGSGFSVQRVQVLSVAAGVATCDKSLGTTASTGGTGNMGGALLTIAQAITLTNTASFDAAFGNTIHVKAGTYTITTALGPTPSVGNLFIVGFQTTHNDRGTKPLITTSTNSCNIFTLGNGVNWTIFNNLSLSSTAASARGAGIEHIGTGGEAPFWVTNCLLDGFQWPVCADNFNFNTVAQIVLENTEIKNAVTTGGGTNAGTGVQSVGPVALYNCYIHDCALFGVKVTSGNLRMYKTVVDSCTSDGVVYSVTNGAFESLFSVFSNNGGDGLDLSGSGAYNPAGTARLVIFLLQNNIFWSNNAYGVNWFTFYVPVQSMRTNAYGDNTSGARNNLAAGVGDVTLTVSPFTSSTDFSLNNTAGGGAACRDAGFQRTY